MKKINIHQVDSFAAKIFGGNPAGVVTGADSLTDDEMGKIAREMYLSETAFVLKPESKEADLKLRYFTRSGVEVDFCGHATVGALYELARLGQIGSPNESEKNLKVETGAGILDMSVINNSGGQPTIKFVAPDVKIEEHAQQGEDFAGKFGISADSLLPNSKILIDTVLNYIYIPIKSLKKLGGLQFNNAKIRQNFGSENIIVFCLYAGETFNKDANLHARVVCPLIGIDEDPFTGSVQSGLVKAAKENKIIDQDLVNIVTEQGNFMGRPGFAKVNHDILTDEISITSQAVHVFSAEMEL